MKFISWNVNGLRACLKKGFEDVFNALDADFFCIQETKMQPGQADFAPAGYTEYIYSADKKGYSGTAIWAKTPALSVRYGLDEDVHNHEGRAITLEYPDFYLVNLYVPNSQNELARIDYRMQWEDDLRRYLQKLDAEKPVILCGDLNVALVDGSDVQAVATALGQAQGGVDAALPGETTILFNGNPEVEIADRSDITLLSDDLLPGGREDALLARVQEVLGADALADNTDFQYLDLVCTVFCAHRSPPVNFFVRPFLLLPETVGLFESYSLQNHPRPYT